MNLLKAYEMDGGPTGIYWEVYGEIEEGMPDNVKPDDMGDYIADIVSQGRDMEIKTLESYYLNNE